MTRTLPPTPGNCATPDECAKLLRAMDAWNDEALEMVHMGEPMRRRLEAFRILWHRSVAIIRASRHQPSIDATPPTPSWAEDYHEQP